MTNNTIELLGVEVSITLGKDGIPVIFIDTPNIEDSENGPKIRVRLNDEPIYSIEQQANLKETKKFFKSLMDCTNDAEASDMLMNDGAEIEKKLNEV